MGGSVSNQKSLRMKNRFPIGTGFRHLCTHSPHDLEGGGSKNILAAYCQNFPGNMSKSLLTLDN